MAILEIHNHLLSYLNFHDESHRNAALDLARRLRATGLEHDDPETLLHADIAMNLIETTGPAGAIDNGISDALLDRCRTSAASCPVDHELHPLAANILIKALVLRATTIQPTDPDQARALATEAVSWLDRVEGSLPQVMLDVMLRLTDPLRGGRRADLAAVVAQAPPVEGHLGELLRSISLGTSVLTDPEGTRRELLDPTKPAWYRASTGLGIAGRVLSEPSADPALGLTFAEDAAEAVAQVTLHGSDPHTTGHGLITFDGTLREIVSIVLGLAGDVPDLTRRAAVLLERGRGLILARLLDSDADLENLQASHPLLARRFTEIAQQLGIGHSAQDRLADLRSSQELDDLTAGIRRLPGFEDFQRGPSAEQLQAAAEDGPIVILNHGDPFCHALILRPAGITALLLKVDPAHLTTTAKRFHAALNAINATGSHRPAPAQIVEAARVMRETLSWTWHRITAPALHSLGITDPVPDETRIPRVWWVPSGSFNALPLHAAQCNLPDCPESDCASALDACVSSYAPSVRVLRHARRGTQRTDRQTSGALTPALIIAEDDDHIPGSASAAVIAAEHLGAADPLIGTDATRERVLDALAAAKLVHFSCHAVADPTSPLGSRIHLPSGQEPAVTDIFRTRSASARLAFLSGCGTAQTAERQADEAIHLASAFLVAGYPQAIGTLWEIESTRAGTVVREFYHRLATTMDTAETDAESAAVALHYVVRALRDAHPHRPQDWAAYVHAGV
ncbi:hypothetical protein ABIA31_009294 [Catenulispora sp. MAP5-51]|uniref:CHAT domain-containing protein n=1 Tax=Catenulispora sp. MAP5-51 TaxID=3156298 RepID=UPI003517804D